MAAFLRASARAGVTGLLLLSAVSAGHARPDARTLTCAQVQALLQREGTAVISTGAHTFDRFASANASCGGLDRPLDAAISTKDTDRCPVYQCGRRIGSPSR
jgi:hypothetical protein